ncbi:phage terminase small subunit [Yersinia ruckeri]|uniref:phage terminase small subunit n=1 Tax=Yersinia ruckeri TaxID=29486 RepID=UPI0005DCC053|nr:phage terminase small subunit [Yersinia ruckeri]MCK8560927.1 hypothetical protein [Yersinia ruckeri]MCK8563469.1 hypothetical protein [Yersinia ruckeri]MCW6525950.1 phage terminase small subunit [Yersinia ruckeri]MCW6560763.1 phage terminase small subunit [Yersinia ruckeri]OJB77905.1 hypothetical protein A9Q62_06855 [Yersinia ruckeri]
MLSPARRHFLRQSAAEQQRDNPLRHATGYERLLQQLRADEKKLRMFRSMERKAELKREMLPAYTPWVAGVLSSGTGAQDAVLMTVMVWRLDTGDIAGALEIAPYALRHKLVSPDSFTRPTPYLLVEVVAETALRAYDREQPVDIAPLLQTMELTEQEDMPDQVRAKLHKITGYVLAKSGKAELALNHLKRALQLHRGCGVIKDIERLERQLRLAASR